MTLQEFKQLKYFQDKNIDYNNFIDATDGSTELVNHEIFTALLYDLSHELKADFCVDFIDGEDGYYQVLTKVVTDLIVCNYFMEIEEMYDWLSEDNQLEGLYNLCMELKINTAKHKEYIIKTIKEL